MDSWIVADFYRLSLIFDPLIWTSGSGARGEASSFLSFTLLLEMACVGFTVQGPTLDHSN